MAEHSSIRIRGRNYPVQKRISVGRKSFDVLDRLSHFERKRYLVFDRSAGFGGELRVLTILQRGPETTQHLKVLKRLSESSANYPAIVEFHAERDSCSVVQQHVAGQDLRTYLDKVKAGRAPHPSAVESLKLVRGLAHGLSRLHDHRNLVHGDLKPENLILVRSPNRLVMVDFGSAWTVEATTRRTAGDGVSNQYAAPEQFTESGRADFRSDQFAVSVVLYELLTLKIPYDNVGGQAGVAEHRAAFANTFVPPSEAHPDRQTLPAGIWSQIDELVRKGAAFDPNDRFPNRSDWLREFDDIDAKLKLQSPLGPVERFFVGWLDRWLKPKAATQE